MSDVPISKTDENKVVAYRNGAEVILNDPDCISIQADSAASNWAQKNVQASYNIWMITVNSTMPQQITKIATMDFWMQKTISTMQLSVELLP
jgi:hypothetical protein